MRCRVVPMVVGCIAAVSLGCGTEPVQPEPGGESVSVAHGDLFLGTAFFDPPNCHAAVTQCNGMHCCPFGAAMTGAHYDTNTFRCSSVAGAMEIGCFVTNSSHTRTLEGITMKGCAVGFYMKGHHVGNNQLTCCPYPSFNAATDWTLDGHGEAPAVASDPLLLDAGATCSGGTMHACPDIAFSSAVMEGVNVFLNAFLCGGSPNL